ncbi:hypothetical protein ACFQZZ_32440 [Nocardia sp. GCM10030253]|uniref:hypothetical protein n=1 Tax=Nocardia sp. GCM10030253 TaxID=3273404 RepID=UPI00363AC4AC
MQIVQPLLAHGIWPILAFFVLVSVVSVVALVRAEAKDVPLIFKAFAAAFGFRGPEDEDAGTTGNEGNAGDDVEDESAEEAL